MYGYTFDVWARLNGLKSSFVYFENKDATCGYILFMCDLFFILVVIQWGLEDFKYNSSYICPIALSSLRY